VVPAMTVHTMLSGRRGNLGTEVVVGTRRMWTPPNGATEAAPTGVVSAGRAIASASAMIDGVGAMSSRMVDNSFRRPERDAFPEARGA
jgi:hypothetical protein